MEPQRSPQGATGGPRDGRIPRSDGALTDDRTDDGALRESERDPRAVCRALIRSTASATTRRESLYAARRRADICACVAMSVGWTVFWRLREIACDTSADVGPSAVKLLPLLPAPLMPD